MRGWDWANACNWSSCIARLIYNEISLQQKVLDVITDLRFVVSPADYIEIFGKGGRIYIISLSAITDAMGQTPR
jgi:hypothetical protein